MDASGNFHGAQGRFKRGEPGTIYIDINAGLNGKHDVGNLAKYTMLRTFAHEFTHFIEKWNPVQYNEFRKVVFDTLRERGENVDDLVEAKQAAGLSYDMASREVVAEAMTDILPDSHFVQNLAEKHKSIFQKLMEKLKEFVEGLRSYFDSLGKNRSREANALKEQVGETVRYVENIVKMFDQVAEQAVENYQLTAAAEQTAEFSQEQNRGNSERGERYDLGRNDGDLQTISSGLDGRTNSGKSADDLGQVLSPKEWSALDGEKQQQIINQLDAYTYSSEEAEIVLSLSAKGDISDEDIRREAVTEMARQFYEAMQGDRVLLENDGRFRWLGDMVGLLIEDVQAIQDGTFVADEFWEQEQRRDYQKYSYEWFAAKPDMPMTVVDMNFPNNHKAVVQKAKDNAATIGRVNPKDRSVSVYVDDIGTNIVLGTKGLRHGLDRRFSLLAPITIKAGEIIKNSILINEITPRDNRAMEGYVLIGIAKASNGQIYIVRSVVNRFANELASMDVLYAINAKKEPAGRLSPQGGQHKSSNPSGSKISIASLLSIVNQHFPDVLPEDVLKHYGHDRRPDGTFSEDVLYQQRTSPLTDRDVLETAANDIGISDMSDAEQAALQTFKDRLAELHELQEKRAEAGRLYKEQQFGANVDRQAASQTLERMYELDKQIAAASRKVLGAENSKVLKPILQYIRKSVEKKERERSKAVLERWRDRRDNAEAMTDILPDTHFVQNLAEKHKSIFQKLMEKLKEFVESLRSYFDSLGKNRSREANALKEQVGETVRYVENIVKMFDQVAEQAVENYQLTAAAEQTAEFSQEQNRGNSERGERYDQGRINGNLQTDSSRLDRGKSPKKGRDGLGATSSEKEWSTLDREKQQQIINQLDAYTYSSEEAEIVLPLYVENIVKMFDQVAEQAVENYQLTVAAEQTAEFSQEQNRGNSERGERYDEGTNGENSEKDSPGLVGEGNTKRSGSSLSKAEPAKSWKEIGGERQEQIVDCFDLYTYGSDEAELYLGKIAKGDISDEDIRREAVTEMARQFYEAMQGDRVLLENDGRFRWLGDMVGLLIEDVQAIQDGTFVADDFWEQEQRRKYENPNEPQGAREWSVFNRSLANKTSSLTPGQTKRIFISTANHIYLVEATGYMSYDNITKISLKFDRDKVNDIRRRFLNGSDKSRELSDRLAEGFGVHRGRGDWHRADNGYAKEARPADVLDGGESEGDTAGYLDDYYGFGSGEELSEAIRGGALVLDDDGNLIQLLDDEVQEQRRDYIDEGYATDSTNWAYENFIIDETDRARFYEVIADLNKRNYSVPRNKNGVYMIEHNNKIMFTDGDFKAPTLSKVIVFDTNYDANMAYAKGRIFDEERRTAGHGEAVELLNRMYGDGFIHEYNARNYQRDDWQDRRGEGSNRRSTGKAGSGRRIFKGQYQERTSPLTDRDVLEAAANDVGISDMSDAEQAALQTFKDRLTELHELQEERAEAGRLYKEQQFGANVDRQAASVVNYLWEQEQRRDYQKYSYKWFVAKP